MYQYNLILRAYDKEYYSLVEHILNNEEVKQMVHITHHHYTNRLQHSILVSYISYRIAKRLHLDCASIARAALLHDFFLEDREAIGKLNLGSHAQLHPKLACENASKIIELSKMEQDIILKHMFLVSKCGFPRYKESFVVTFVDKYVSIREVTSPFASSVASKTKLLLARLLPSNA